MSSTSRPKTLIFVYGSLKRGYQLSPLLRDQEFLGEAQTEACYRLYDLGEYPGLVEHAEGLSIRGEIYRVDDECLRHLDEVEGVEDGLYERCPVSLRGYSPATRIDAWICRQSVAGLPDCGDVWPRT